MAPAHVPAHVHRRPNDESGFGLVELLIAMSVMIIGILALFAMFQSSVIQVKRASTTSTAAALADSEMETFRAAKYAVLGLDDTAVAATDGTYKTDGAYVATTGVSSPPASGTARVHLGACGTGTCTTAVPSRSVTGADGRSYRVDVFMSWQPVSSGRYVKLITVVVRDALLASRVWARVASSFDESTGL